MRDIIKKSFDFNDLQGQDIYVDLQDGFTNTRANIPSMVKTWHEIDRNEPVYAIFYNKILKKGDFFTADRTYHCSACIREEGISFYCSVETSGWAADESDNVGFSMAWEEIEEVDITNNRNQNDPNALIIKGDPIIEMRTEVFRFYFKGDHSYISIPIAYFGEFPRQGKSAKALMEGFNKLLKEVEVLEQEKQVVDEEFQKVLDKLLILIDNKEYDKYLEAIEEYGFWNTDNLAINAGLLEAFVNLGRDSDAEEIYERIEQDYKNMIANLEENNTDAPEFLEIRNGVETIYQMAKGLISKQRGCSYEAARSFQLVKHYGESNLDFKDKKMYNEEIQNAYGQYIQKFDTLPYEERKVITMTNTDKLFKTENLTLLQLNMLPTNVKFPITHPKKDHTYICHPWDSSIYLPIEDYDMELLNDRVNEYCYLMQCLGATNIQIKNRKGESLSENKNKEANNKVNVGYKVVSAGGNYDENIKNEEENHSRFSFAREQTFDPTKKPFIPENLIWFPHEVAWQRLAQQRLDGAILQHSEMVSSSQNKVLSHSEMRDINADLSFLFVELGGGRKTEEDYTISMNEEVEWEISVKFKPIEDFDKVSNSNFTSISETIYVEEVSSYNFTNEEEQFMEEVKHALEDDGVICDKESQYLERLRQRLNISEEKGKELLNKIVSSYHKDSNQFSEEEKQYIEEVRYMLEDDDQIDEKENQMLSRIRERLGISESRAEELKNSIILSWKKEEDLTDEEKEYLKDFEMFIRDGEIQERERRMLNRLAGLLGISEERAMELERNYLF